MISFQHLFLSILCTPLAMAEQPLNILIFFVDDLGVMDVSPYNHDTFYDTPAIQRLADSGMRFSDGYAASPVCSPSRSALLTGQWPSRTRNTQYFGGPNEFLGQELPENHGSARGSKFGWRANYPLWPAPFLGQLADKHTTLAEALKSQGYSTFFAGKWHLGGEGSLPTDHGFDTNLGGHAKGGPYGGDRYFSPYDNPYLPDGPEGEHLTGRLASETADFIGRSKDKPFFAMLSFYAVHTPLMGRPDLVEKYQARRAERELGDQFESEHPRMNRTHQSHAIYGAMVEAMDQAVGKVLDALDDHGVADKTLVIFTSDNGGLSTSEGSPTTNLPFRAGKGWLYEGGIREPVIIRWPGVTPKGSVSPWHITGTDFYPTILEAAGLPMLPEQHMDGQSAVPALKDPTATNHERPLYWHFPHWGNQGGVPGSALRLGDWKLIDWKWHRGTELFNLKADPSERNNLAESHPEMVAKLRKKLDALHTDTQALMPTVNPKPKLPFLKW